MTALTRIRRPGVVRPAASGEPVGRHERAVRVVPWLLGLEAGLAVVAAGLPWLRAFAVPGARIVLLGGAALSVVPALVVAAGLRRPASLSVALSAALLLVVVLAAVAHDPRAVRAGLIAGPTGLLTETLPLTGTRALVLGPLLLVWVSGSAVAELILRSRKASAAAFLPPVAGYVAAYAATSGAPGSDEGSGALLLGALILLAVTQRAARAADGVVVDAAPVSGTPAGGVRVDRSPGAGGSAALPASPEQGSPVTGHRHTGPRRSWLASPTGRSAAVGVLVGGIVVGALGVGIPRIPALRRPVGLERRPEVLTLSLVDPVDVLAALREDDPSRPPVTLFRVHTDAATSGYAALAYLDDYDGNTWSLSSTFIPTGGRIPASASVGADGHVTATAVDAEVTILRTYGLPLIPVIGRPLALDGVPVDADAPTGMVVPTQALRAPMAYRFRSVAPPVTLAGVDPADQLQLTGQGAGADLGLPAGTGADLVAGLRFLASITGRRPAPSVAFLQAADRALRRVDRIVNPATSSSSAVPTASRGGTSLAEVITAVVIHERATPEQFATFFVLMARELGVPARIATGFRIAPPGAGDLPAGTYEVTNRQAWTWAQVPVVGVGGVAAAPTPTLSAQESAPPPVAAASTPTTTTPPRQASAPGAGLGGSHALAPPVRPRRSAGPSGLGAAGWGGAALFGLLVVLGLLGPGQAAARRALRRRLRHRGDPAGSAVGAWLEVLDALEVGGWRPPVDATADEVACGAADAFGPELHEPVAAIGAVAEQALYAPGRPPSSEASAAAWVTLRTLRAGLRCRLDRRSRVRAAMRVGHQARRSDQRSSRHHDRVTHR
jgi:hypothetical protein